MRNLIFALMISFILNMYFFITLSKTERLKLKAAYPDFVLPSENITVNQVILDCNVSKDDKLDEIKPLDKHELRQWHSNWQSPYISLFPNTNSSEIKLQLCLQKRWIYIMGDSTARFWMNALLILLYNQFQDLSLKKYLLFDGRATPGTVQDHKNFLSTEGCHQDLVKDKGCMREFFDRDNGIRITFVWIIKAGEGINYLDFLTGHQNTPDLFVVSIGAWDILLQTPVATGALHASNWVVYLTDTFPDSLVVAMTPNACTSAPQELRPWITEFSIKIQEKIPLYQPARLALFEREQYTRNMEGDQCDGYHVLPDDLNLQQVLSVLTGICTI